MQISAPLKVLHTRLYGKLTQGLSYWGSQGKPGVRTLLPSWCLDPRSIPNGTSIDGLHVSVPSPCRKLSHGRSMGCWNLIRHSTEQQALFRDRHLTVANCRLRSHLAPVIAAPAALGMGLWPQHPSAAGLSEQMSFSHLSAAVGLHQTRTLSL